MTIKDVLCLVLMLKNMVLKLKFETVELCVSNSKQYRLVLIVAPYFIYNIGVWD